MVVLFILPYRPTSKDFPTGSINYTVCNVGSVFNTDNSTTCNMLNRSRFEYVSGNYTALPCWTNSNGSYSFPSLNSSGRVYSISTSTTSGIAYYPARSTYGIMSI